MPPCVAFREGGGALAWLILILASIRATTSTRTSFANVTLSSFGGDLSAVVFLPQGLKPEESAFYTASRFDHGSMIGSITRKQRTTNSKGEEVVKSHVLYEIDMWRQPHNSNWPESGVGLASEFGVGDDGAFCYFQCGWSGVNDVTNGVLGYREARNGESFLKIGVGELLKGTCPKCDSTDDYRFNSPYQFAKPPEWKILEISDHRITLEHEARVKIFGYKLLKEISLNNDVLSVTTTLQNLSLQPFSTAWYSHNFFSCDGTAVGPGYSLDLGLKGDTEPLYAEPGTWSWTTALEEYAKIKRRSDDVHVEMVRALGPGVRIKTEFANDGETTGSFKVQACGTSISSDISKVGEQDGLSMYGYNLYIERGTLSPEPQILIYLDPGATASWTQRLIIGDMEKEPVLPPVADAIDNTQQQELMPPLQVPSLQFLTSSLEGGIGSSRNSTTKLFGFSLLLVTTTALMLLSRRRRQRNHIQYTSIPDLDLEER